MRILLSAFACDPEQGSEPGVGWAWAEHLAKSGHDVHVLTRPRSMRQSQAMNQYLPNLRFTYIGVRWVPFNVPGLGVYPFYFIWQWKAYVHVKRCFDLRNYDCVHHLTYGSVRTPFFLSLLPLASIFGPVGGGDDAPVQLMQSMSLAGKLQETARRVVNFLSLLNPITRMVWRRASLILAATEGTLRMVPRRYWKKSRLLPAITAPRPQKKASMPLSHSRDGLRVLFVGRLLEWKGLHLAILALPKVKGRVPAISLSVRGDGPCKKRFRNLARSEGVENLIQWIPRFTTRDEVLEVYDKHDVLIFPSLHDSGGAVVLEAMSRGLPVICLKLGGPAIVVNDHCGACIDPSGRSEEEVIQSIADELVRFGRLSEHEKEAVRDAARDRASQFTTSRVIQKGYSWFEEIHRNREKHDALMRS